MKQITNLTHTDMGAIVQNFIFHGYLPPGMCAPLTYICVSHLTRGSLSPAHIGPGDVVSRFPLKPGVLQEYRAQAYQAGFD